MRPVFPVQFACSRASSNTLILPSNTPFAATSVSFAPCNMVNFISKDCRCDHCAIVSRETVCCRPFTVVFCRSAHSVLEVNTKNLGIPIIAVRKPSRTIATVHWAEKRWKGTSSQGLKPKVAMAPITYPTRPSTATWLDPSTPVVHIPVHAVPSLLHHSACGVPTAASSTNLTVESTAPGTGIGGGLLSVRSTIAWFSSMYNSSPANVLVPSWLMIWSRKLVCPGMKIKVNRKGRRAAVWPGASPNITAHLNCCVAIRELSWDSAFGGGAARKSGRRVWVCWWGRGKTKTPTRYWTKFRCSKRRKTVLVNWGR